MKTCPFCAEEIQDAAVKCRYCGSDLRAAPPPPAQVPCPFCAELITEGVSDCPICRSSLITAPPPTPIAAATPGRDTLPREPASAPARRVEAPRVEASRPEAPRAEVPAYSVHVHAAPPPAPPPPAPRYWTPGRLLLAAVGVPGTFLLAIACMGVLFGHKEPGGELSGGILSQPSFRIISQDADDCSSLTDVCVRVSCTVGNVGSAPGTATVYFGLTQSGNTPLASSQTAYVQVAAQSAVSHEFWDATLSLDPYEYTCSVQ